MHLACRGLTFRYPGADAPVFRGLDWALDVPGLHALFGFSGCGKSTLARLLARELAPQAGECTAPPGGPVLYAHNAERLPGWQTVAAHLDSVTPAPSRRLLDDLVAAYDLAPVTGHRFGALSMGQKNRVNLVRYLVQPFAVLILDEILANVDEPMRERILGDLKRRFPDRLLLYISHNALEVARYCRRVHVVPHARGGVRRLRSLDALDRPGGGEPAPDAAVQRVVYDVLRAASREAA
ncbi:ATP-binding cassette domain-containing protein [Dissulfurirhabdus thermomarina]|uniref:ATP-binding cassette domain-containing protein n=1 Tax=Dissulfurirhabdus thermomarina TaxID=1765737 RepID=A0A6N9TPD9_DISTH|nr:ATP-binding cassette domain-containing protein [Dissulfurirhabdus thermomarina]NDY41963.1 ATP-binding cassette domain-containing protein [Dissulfurirhabdus thermomarina]NMX22814.1 ATP-binding cassette domain-containing protein [Dissulfurirhabdus thermomarina]